MTCLRLETRPGVGPINWDHWLLTIHNYSYVFTRKDLTKGSNMLLLGFSPLTLCVSDNELVELSAPVACRPSLSGGRPATRKWPSTRTSSSCCRLLWTTPRRSCRRASPCRATSTRSTAARRPASCSPRSTPHRRTTTSTPGDRYVATVHPHDTECLRHGVWLVWVKKKKSLRSKREISHFPSASKLNL